MLPGSGSPLLPMLKNQNISTKQCPTCPTGKIYTGERGKRLNPRVDGIQVCEECVLKSIYSKYFKDRDNG